MLRLITYPNPIGYVLLQTIAQRNTTAIAAAKATHENEDQEGLDAMASDLILNTNKQGWVLTTSLVLASLYVWEVGPEGVLNNGLLWNIAGGLTVAWFVITFSSVKSIFLDSATVLTYLMFTAFTLPWTAVALSAIVAPSMGWAETIFVVVPITFAWIAAATYDSLDLLRGNMDELAVEFFRRGARGRLAVEIDQSADV